MKTTIDSLIRNAESRLRSAENRLVRLQDLETDRKSELQRERQSPAGDSNLRQIQEAMTDAGSEAEGLRQELKELEVERAADTEMASKQSQLTPTAAGLRHERSSGSTTFTNSREEYTAQRDQRGERSYFADLFRSEVLNDVGSRQRVSQFMAERSTSTSSYGGLVVPQFLLDQAALLARAGRPYAQSVAHLPIPDQGMTLTIPRGTTGSSTAVQTTENTAVSATDEVWANLVLNVATVAGQATPSRQSLERGMPGLDALIFADLANAYAVNVDQQCLSGTGTSGQILGVLNTAGVGQATAFTAAVTVASFYSKVAGMIATVSAQRGMPPDSIAMHPRRYSWLLAQLDSAGRPLVTPAPEQGPMNSMGVTGEAPSYGMNAGKYLGLQIVVDANIPIAVGSGPEDQVIVYRAADQLLFENDPMPTELRFEQTAGTTLTVTLVAYGYIAFTAGRYPSATALVGGNSAATYGLVTPTF